MSRLSTELLIEPSIVRDNILKLKNQIEDKSNFMAIIKSDAYGHILTNIVRDIDDLVDGYGVVRLEEAIELRKLSKKKILLMQGVYSNKDFLILYFHQSTLLLSFDQENHRSIETYCWYLLIYLFSLKFPI